MDMNRDVKGDDVTVEAVPVEGDGVPVHDVVEKAVEAQLYVPMLMEVADPSDASQAIRDDFIYCLCCAFSCQYCDLPNCFGSRSECTVCCVQNSSVCYKVVKDEKACCIFQSGGSEIVYPRVWYSEYWQCCCIEYYAALPILNGPFKKINNRPDKISMNFTPASDGMFFNGWCCCYKTCNCNFPSCLGTYCKCAQCCGECECMQMKPMCCVQTKLNKDTLCVWSHCHNLCVVPSTCCKCISSACCAECRCAVPCDEEVPCIFGAIPFCTCCVDWGVKCTCCASINSLMKNKKGDAVVNLVKSGVGVSTTHTVINPVARNNQQMARAEPIK